MTFIKICGLRTAEDIELCCALGANALGFNFYEPSPRYIEPRELQGMLSAVPRNVWKVGVFVNAAPEFVKATAKLLALDTLQFHGDEDPDYCKQFSDFRVMKALRVSDIGAINQIERFEQVSERVLLDAAVEKMFGGTGSAIESKLLHELQSREMLTRLILAGGLNADNVSERLRVFQPWGVDTASGVESSPGVKDPQKIGEFIRNVRAEETSS